jgi:hypothetical protein
MHILYIFDTHYLQMALCVSAPTNRVRHTTIDLSSQGSRIVLWTVIRAQPTVFFAIATLYLLAKTSDVIHTKGNNPHTSLLLLGTKLCTRWMSVCTTWFCEEIKTLKYQKKESQVRYLIVMCPARVPTQINSFHFKVRSFGNLQTLLV